MFSVHTKSLNWQFATFKPSNNQLYLNIAPVKILAHPERYEIPSVNGELTSKRVKYWELIRHRFLSSHTVTKCASWPYGVSLPARFKPVAS